MCTHVLLVALKASSSVIAEDGFEVSLRACMGQSETMMIEVDTGYQCAPQNHDCVSIIVQSDVSAIF